MADALHLEDDISYLVHQISSAPHLPTFLDGRQCLSTCRRYVDVRRDTGLHLASESGERL